MERSDGRTLTDEWGASDFRIHRPKVRKKRTVQDGNTTHSKWVVEVENQKLEKYSLIEKKVKYCRWMYIPTLGICIHIDLKGVENLIVLLTLGLTSLVKSEEGLDGEVISVRSVLIQSQLLPDVYDATRVLWYNV